MRCVEPVGTFGCVYDAHGAEPHPELCYHHAKAAAGLIACPSKGCSRKAGHRPPCSAVPEHRMTMTPDQQLSDESREIIRVLRRASA